MIFLLIYIGIGLVLLISCTIFEPNGVEDLALNHSRHTGLNIYLTYLIIDMVMVFGGLPIIIWSIIDIIRRDKKL